METHLSAVKQRYQASKSFVSRYSNVLFFIGGFVFDAFTLVRIDSTLDLLLQALYLASITFLLIAEMRVEERRWTPPGRIARLWPYKTEILHFFYGGLLSAYVIFYFKSTSFSRSLFFLSIILFLMIANEMPQIRRTGFVLRMGLYAFCVVSFLNYLLPVLIGRMGWWVFLSAWILSGGIVAKVVQTLARHAAQPRRLQMQLGWAPGAVLALILVLYSVKLIPPVPLSLQYVGIYQNVQREGNRFKLVYRKPPWTRFWAKDERLFLARPGDLVHCFVRVFAPRRFSHQIFIRWSKKDEAKDRWVDWDRVPLSIRGGREQGYRGFVAKEHYEPGSWRVEVETEDGRVLGARTFKLQPDSSTEERQWKVRWM